MSILDKDLEITSTVPPAKMFQAFVLEADELFPKILPQAFKSIDIIKGDGGAGTIKRLTFVEGEQLTYANQRVDLLDKEKFIYHYSWIEGDALTDTFEKVTYEIKFEEHQGGCVCKINSKFHVVGDIQLDEELLEGGKEKVVALFKAVEGYVLANP